MTAHVHAALMAEYAKDASETDKPWERWECNWNGVWKGVLDNPTWAKTALYRRKRAPLCQIEVKLLRQAAAAERGRCASIARKMNRPEVAGAIEATSALTPDWTTMSIFYWPDGTWCYRHELEQMTHMSDDYGELRLLPGRSGEEIEAAVQAAIQGGYK